MSEPSKSIIPDRKDVEATFQQFGQLIKAALKPLPSQTGDGTYIEKAVTTGVWHDMKKLDPKDVETILDVLKQKMSGAQIDDREYLMENVIQLAAELPDLSKNRHRLTGGLIADLWTSLQHPPISYLGDKFAYRRPDGSGNNIMYPQLGAANTPYARSVCPKVIRPAAQPDPGLIFDCLMARTKYKPHENKISSVLFYLASIIIHDLFHTSHDDFSISKTSSYLDLAPLYGSSEDDQKSLRTFQDGKIKPDCFVEKRLLGFPPGVAVLLIMFNRFHNYVVEQLAVINEGGRFTKPTDKDDPRFNAKLAKYDNDLFQTARLVTCGLYVNIILLDYVRTIINLNRTNSTWNLDPCSDASIFGQDGVPRGVGNQVSAEFNLIYRWHACISEKDDKWTQDLYRKLFPGRNPSDISMGEFLGTLSKWEKTIPADPHERSFADLKRGSDGTFNNDELVKILSESIEDPAGAFGAQNVPPIMRNVEILGIIQARAWNVASLNEFRKFFGLKPHETFEEINSDPHIADQLRHLYDHPDYVELYPGVAIEEPKKSMTPGSGLMTTFTISRAILSDAVTLIRSDRFYTVDYTPRNLTNWGFHEVSSDLSIEQGCVFYKLFLRAFPQHFKPNSVYAHYPLTTPTENHKILTDLGRVDQYNFDKPGQIKQPFNITSYTAAKQILENQKDFHVTWGEGLEAQIGPVGGKFMLAGDGPEHALQRKRMGKCLYQENWHKQVKEFYETITLKLLRQKSYKLAGTNTVDIVRDVGNIAQAHFAANVFALPLKTETNPLGIYTEQQLYLVLTVMFIRVFFNLDPVKDFPLTLAAKTLATQLGKLIETNVDAIAATGWLSGIIDKLHEHHTALSDYGVHMIRNLLDTGLSKYDVTWSQMVPSAAAMVANQGQIFSQIVDYYISDAGKEHWPEIHRLSNIDNAESDEKLLRYAMEGIRIADAFGAYRKVVNPQTVDDNGKQIHFQPGDTILISFVDYSKDPKVFPEPEKVKLDRPLDSYLHYGAGPHICLGKEISETAITAMLRTVGKLKNLRRVPGPQGQLQRIPRQGGFVIYMKEDWSDYFPFPTTMKVQWDGDLPELPSAEGVKANGNGVVAQNGTTNGTTDASTNGTTNGSTDGTANRATNGAADGH